MPKPISRRELLKSAAAAAASFTIIPSGILAKGASPNEKLNIAYIGCGNRGNQNLKEFLGENIVALCDPNSKNMAGLAKRIPNFRGQTFEDWRKCLDMKGIDAVVVQPPDHHHAFINIWALNRDYHIYSEKPLGNSVGEVRAVRELYLKKKGKLATQVGMQRHELANMHRVTELIHDGAIGKPSQVQLWCGRTPTGGDFPPAEPVPSYLNWDLWCGPSQMVDFNSALIAGGCLKWNKYWPFGCGQLTDMGSHIMDIAWWALDLGQPTSVKAEGSECTKATVPTWITAEWEHPANDWRPEVKVQWYDGGKMPGMPNPLFDKNNDKMKGDHAIFKGDQGWLICDFQNRILIPSAKNGDLTYFKPRTKETQIPQSPGHHKEWILACKGDKATRTDFDYAGTLTEQNLLALVGYRFPNQKLEYDPKAGKITNVDEANQYIHKTYRPGWMLNG